MENMNLKVGARVGIIGLGLIGGSILKALSALKEYELIGISKSSYKKAAEFCILSSPDINDAKDCDIVFVCARMSETPDILDKLQDIVHPSCIICDVSSLKRFVNKKQYSFNFIGSHPMAGTEFSGFDASFAELFHGAKWILNKENTLLEDLIKKMGAKPVIIDENTHDKQTCLISHLPMLISAALLNTVIKEDKNALNIASSGFRDTTRLSLTDTALALDMLELNGDNFDIYIDKFIENLKELKNMPKTEFINTLKSIQKIRKTMYDNNGKNIL